MDKMTHEIKNFKNTNLPNYQLKQIISQSHAKTEPGNHDEICN
jgi:hypothetical protein